nr:putative zinc finger, CCHC-type [Tanacetum cinerariifolium]
PKAVNTARPNSVVVNAVRANQGNPQLRLQEKGVIDSGCSRHMTVNMSYLFEYEEINGGYVAFGGDFKGEEFQQPMFEGYRPKTSNSVNEDISNEVKESHDASLVKKLVSDDKLEKKTVFLTVAKIEFVRPKQQQKSVRKPVKYAEMY